MAEAEQALLHHYSLTNLYPSEWPAERDDSEGSGDELQSSNISTASALRQLKSRYSILERLPSSRSSLPGSQRTADGAENIVQRDEPDPLGGPVSVVQVLRQKGLPVDNDLKLRNRFLLSSTTFSPAMFLSQVHDTASTESLLQGLDFLSRSIEQKSASLKVLVESNFERFVRAKVTIDDVYNQMRNQGAQSEQEQQERRPGSRHASKSTPTFRKASGPFSPGVRNDRALPSDKKKNALVKESDYGVQGIKAPLIEIAIKAEEVWGPALGGHEREEGLQVVLNAIGKNRGAFQVGPAIRECIQRQDYEGLVEQYARARKYAKDAKAIADNAVRNQVPLADPEIHQIIVTARMWTDVESQIESFKKTIWRKLTDTQRGVSHKHEGGMAGQHIQLISILLEIGVEENPIWVWLVSRYDQLKSRISASSERSRVQVEILRRRLASAENPSYHTIAGHFRGLGSETQEDHDPKLDNPNIINFWERAQSFLNTLLSTQRGLLGEVVEFWDNAQSFFNGKAQKTLPTGIDGQSRHHHLLSNDAVRQLQNGTAELVKIIRDVVLAFFTDPPVDDISMLYTPLEPVPDTPTSAVLTPAKDSRFDLDPKSIPPVSPKTGEAWEKYAFWAPYANSLSGTRYMSAFMSLVGIAASEMASIGATDQDQGLEKLRTMVGAVRERCVQAVCAAWNSDAESFKFVEDWTRKSDQRELTNMPSRFRAFESIVLGNMRKILYIPDVTLKNNGTEIIVAPSSKLLQMVRSQFVTSLYKILSGVVENAERRSKPEDGVSQDDADVLAIPLRKEAGATGDVGALDPGNRNMRMLLTLSNLQVLRNDTVPALISQFESHFSVKLSDESKTIRDVLGQIDARLFQSYVKPTINALVSTIHNGISSPTWLPQSSRPSDARPYVYDVLIILVLVHSEVSTTTPPLTGQILSYLLEQISLAFIDAFKKRPKYSLNALMQATLDVEFMAQTLNHYTTEKASETQSQIYLVLDERTDNEARTKLQSELPEMKATLKRLREGTKGEFACFKRQRPSRGDKAERPAQP